MRIPAFLLHDGLRVLVITDAYDHQSTLFSKYSFTSQCPPRIKEYAQFCDECNSEEGDPNEIELRYKDIVHANWVVEYQDGTTGSLHYSPNFIGGEMSWKLEQ